MHMADALLSPGVGGAMLTATAATTLYCARKVQRQLDNRKIPLMGVLGAFIFAAQMINFAIPATGSSGHMGGGLLLAYSTRTPCCLPHTFLCAHSTGSLFCRRRPSGP